MSFSRRSFLALSGAAGLSGCLRRSQDVAKRIVITMDDFNLSEGLPLSPDQRNAQILSAFADHNVQALGFVTGSFVDNEIGRSIVQSWADAGHIIGNHTWTHPFASKTSTAEYTAEIEKNQAFLAGYPTTQKVFRFPFLDEGDTVEHRDTIRNWLNDNGYLNLPVTVDSADWKITSRLEARLRENPNADVSGYRDYYLDASLKAAEYGFALAADLGFPNVPQTFLCHHNELNGMFLNDLLTHFKANGWQVVDAQIAIDHPALQIQPVSLNSQGTLLRVLEADAIRMADQEDLKPRPYPLSANFGEAEMIRRGL